MAKAITAITPKTAYPIIAAFNPATPKYLFEKYANKYKAIKLTITFVIPQKASVNPKIVPC